MRALRLHIGLTQKEFAKKTRVSQPEIARMERKQDIKVSTLTTFISRLDMKGSIRIQSHDGETLLEIDLSKFED